ncbi:serine/threonine protein kinase [Bodo saltans virus]|uniref:Serine/threonine protein kinase n=1 Tax=Bodo saltans virus TaxID=2024608 RepID=A0A2H4UTV9_9VIRU|nr:serine/threonine protein kinase [Bodo saltans virus]ATZ80255.1 serine/threonine protein kinase [Bodo saltans virus]
MHGTPDFYYNNLDKNRPKQPNINNIAPPTPRQIANYITSPTPRQNANYITSPTPTPRQNANNRGVSPSRELNQDQSLKRSWCTSPIIANGLSSEIKELEMKEFERKINSNNIEYFVSKQYSKTLITYDVNHDSTKQLLGEGSFGKVYKGTFSQNNEQENIVIKVINRQQNDSDDLCTEIVTLHKLNHPNVVKFYGFVVEKNYYYIFLEYINGKELNWYITEKKLSIKTKINITMQAIQGLKYLHSINIYHRDIKPANFMISDNHGELVLKYIDFGFSCLKGSICNIGNDYKGTPYYMSPELFRSKIDKTYVINKNNIKYVDLWALGMMIHYMFTGKFILHTRTMEQLINDTANIKQETIQNAIEENFKDILCEVSEAIPLLEIKHIVIKLLSVYATNRKMPQSILLKEFYSISNSLYKQLNENLNQNCNKYY